MLRYFYKRQSSRLLAILALYSSKMCPYVSAVIFNPNYSMFKTKTHHAYIIMMINKESYINKKES